MKTLLNPFENHSETRLISIGILFFLIGSVMAFFFNARFDNFLHLATAEDVSAYQPFIDNLINTSVLFVFLLLAGKLVNAQTRAVDIIAVALVGSAPFYLMSLSNINNLSHTSTNALFAAMANPTAETSMFPLLYLAVVGLLATVILIWTLTVLYRGFKIAANAKSTKAILLFILAILMTIAVTYIIPNSY